MTDKDFEERFGTILKKIGMTDNEKEKELEKIRTEANNKWWRLGWDVISEKDIEKEYLKRQKKKKERIIK